jgi:hypothetical protein
MGTQGLLSACGNTLLNAPRVLGIPGESGGFGCGSIEDERGVCVCVCVYLVLCVRACVSTWFCVCVCACVSIGLCVCACVSMRF